MKKLLKSVLIWYTPEEMYRLVTDVDQYAQFLPWCSHSKVLQFSEHEMDAEVGIGLAGFSQVFVTHNTLGPLTQWVTIPSELARLPCLLNMVLLAPVWPLWWVPCLTK
jgi:ribosome-associated toxin RatA of RatAB toxin-antitoxin module